MKAYVCIRLGKEACHYAGSIAESDQGKEIFRLMVHGSPHPFRVIDREVAVMDGEHGPIWLFWAEPLEKSGREPVEAAIDYDKVHWIYFRYYESEALSLEAAPHANLSLPHQ